MRVALVNNNNNMMFCVARHLRERGYDVTLLLMEHELSEAAHFQPSCDSFDLDFQRYTRTVTWGSGSEFSVRRAETVRQDLAGCDLVVGCGSLPAYMAKIGRKLDVFVPYGSDLYEAPFRPPRLSRRSLRSAVTFPLYQRHGIQQTRVVYGDYSPTIEPPLARLGYKGERVIGPIPMPYGPMYQNLPREVAERSPWHFAVRELRARVDILITSTGRHMWGTKDTDVNWSKGTDKVLRAISLIKKRHPSLRLGLVTYEYGPQLFESKALIHELGLDADVLWLPISNRKDLMANLELSDFACGEFGNVSWYSAGTILEALCMGVPLLHHRDDAQFRDKYPEMYPLLNVKEPEQIAHAILEMYESPDRRKALGHAQKQWFAEYVSKGGTNGIIAAIQKALA